MKYNKLNKFTHRERCTATTLLPSYIRYDVNFCLKRFNRKSIKSHGCEWKLRLIVISHTNGFSRYR